MHFARTDRINRRTLIVGLAAVAGGQAFGESAPAVRRSPIRWSGANGRTLHGYMAIPGRAHGRQPAVLVIGEPSALPPVADPVARRLVDLIADGGLLACTADNVTALADLRASLAWLRFNRYATGKVAVAAFGHGAAIATRLAMTDADIVSALLLLDPIGSPPPALPVLALDWRQDDAALPAGATAFLKEHLAWAKT